MILTVHASIWDMQQLLGTIAMQARSMLYQPFLQMRLIGNEGRLPNSWWWPCCEMCRIMVA